MLLRRRLMGFFSWHLLGVLLAAASPARTAQAEEARAAVRAALEQEATAPSVPPVLPIRSEKVDASRLAREQSAASANGAAAAARSEAANRSAQGAAASAAKSANADSHAAAGQERADEARKKPHGPGRNPQTPPGPPR